MPKSSLFLNEPFHRLDEALARIAQNRRFALAFSGGMDSRFLAYAAQLLGYAPALLHICGPHIPEEETREAEAWAKGRKLELQLIPLDPLRIPEVASGHERRCYFCKKALFQRLGEETTLPLCDGTNLSDLEGYRPGRQALRELGIASPLAEARLGKADIHDLALRTALDRTLQKPRPCLLTRFPYGMGVSRSLLRDVAGGEAAIRETFAEAGLPCPDFRLRLMDEEHAVLHLNYRDREALSPALCEALARAVAQAAPALPPLNIEAVDKLSGFFDKARK